MAFQFSVPVRNARLDVIETTIGGDAVLRIFTGAPPANCATADSGTILAEMTLPTNWMADASGGSKVKAGTWQDLSADNPGIAAHYRIYESTGTTCHIQGTVTITSGGGDMELDNTNIAIGQEVRITSFTLTDGNA